MLKSSGRPKGDHATPLWGWIKNLLHKIQFANVHICKFLIKYIGIYLAIPNVLNSQPCFQYDKFQKPHTHPFLWTIDFTFLKFNLTFIQHSKMFKVFYFLKLDMQQVWKPLKLIISFLKINWTFAKFENCLHFFQCSFIGITQHSTLYTTIFLQLFECNLETTRTITCFIYRFIHL